MKLETWPLVYPFQGHERRYPGIITLRKIKYIENHVGTFALVKVTRR